MGKQPGEYFLHEDLAVFAPPLRVDRILAEPDTVGRAEEEACHAFCHYNDAASVVELFISRVGLGRLPVLIELKGEGSASEDLTSAVVRDLPVGAVDFAGFGDSARI